MFTFVGIYIPKWAAFPEACEPWVKRMHSRNPLKSSATQIFVVSGFANQISGNWHLMLLKQKLSVEKSTEGSPSQKQSSCFSPSARRSSDICLACQYLGRIGCLPWSQQTSMCWEIQSSTSTTVPCKLFEWSFCQSFGMLHFLIQPKGTQICPTFV